MSSRAQRTDSVTEFCEGCRQNTPHQVSITPVTESKRTRNAVHSRKPYRVPTCERCGVQTRPGSNDRR